MKNSDDLCALSRKICDAQNKLMRLPFKQEHALGYRASLRGKAQAIKQDAYYCKIMHPEYNYALKENIVLIKQAVDIACGDFVLGEVQDLIAEFIWIDGRE